MEIPGEPNESKREAAIRKRGELLGLIDAADGAVNETIVSPKGPRDQRGTFLKACLGIDDNELVRSFERRDIWHLVVTLDQLHQEAVGLNLKTDVLQRLALFLLTRDENGNPISDTDIGKLVPEGYQLPPPGGEVKNQRTVLMNTLQEAFTTGRTLNALVLKRLRDLPSRKKYENDNAGEKSPAEVRLQVDLEALTYGKLINASQAELLKRHMLDTTDAFAERERGEISAVLEYFQVRLHEKLTLRATVKDRRDVDGMGLAYLSQLIGSARNGRRPKRRAELEPLSPSIILSTAEIDDLIVETFHWLITRSDRS